MRNVIRHDPSCQIKTAKNRERLKRKKQKQHKQKRPNGVNYHNMTQEAAACADIDMENADTSLCGSCNESSRNVKKNNDYEFLTCNESFMSLHSFLRHRETHYINYPTRYICPTCKQQFRCRQQLAAHVANHPSGSGILHRHSDSDFDSDSDSDITQREEAIVPDEHRLKCIDCDAKFQH